MTKPAIMTVLLSIKALIETDNAEKAIELIDDILGEV